MAQLKIGSSYTLTSAGSGGLTFELAPDEALSPVLTRERFRWPIFLLHATAANEAALKTLVDSVIAELKGASGKDIVYEETASTPLFTMASADYPVVDCEVQTDFMGLECSIAFQLEGRTPDFGVPGGSPPSVPGAVEEIEWQYNMVGNQLGGMTAEGLFKPTTTGTPKTAMENAQAWAASIRSGSGRPSFAPASLRVMEHLFVPLESSGGFNLVRAAIILKELPSAIAGGWPSMVQDCTLNIDVLDREIDIEATGSGNLPSTQISVSGEVTLLTEGSSTFDNSLTSVAPGGVYARALAAINQLLGWFETVYGSEFPARQRVGPPVLNGRLDQGVILFSQLYESDSIIEWEETITKEQQYPTAFSRDFSGADWVYEPEGGPITVVTREFRIVKQGVPPVLPALPGMTKANGWYKTAGSRTVRKAFAPRKGGSPRYQISGVHTFRHAQGQTSSTPADVDALGGLTRQNVAGSNTV